MHAFVVRKMRKQTLGRSKGAGAKKNDKGGDDHEEKDNGKEEVEADHCVGGLVMIAMKKKEM